MGVLPPTSPAPKQANLERFFKSKEDLDGRWLPTLDVSIAMTSSNRLEFTHYEKPTSSNLTLQKRSAMEQNTKMEIMGKEGLSTMAKSEIEQNMWQN